MKRLAFGLILLATLVGVIFLLTQKPGTKSKPVAPARAETEKVSSNVVATEASSSGANSGPQAGALLGETILLGYADTNLPPEHDLTLMSHLMENSLLLLKSAANRPLSANEDWADLFLGRNGIHEHFLPGKHAALNGSGQLIDRWGTALFFHALGGGRYEIRSAGPDKKLWTPDDIHRKADGSFTHGGSLASP